MIYIYIFSFETLGLSIQLLLYNTELLLYTHPSKYIYVTSFVFICIISAPTAVFPFISIILLLLLNTVSPTFCYPIILIRMVSGYSPYKECLSWTLPSKSNHSWGVIKYSTTQLCKPITKQHHVSLPLSPKLGMQLKLIPAYSQHTMTKIPMDQLFTCRVKG